MFIVLNRANLVVSVTESVTFVRSGPGGLPEAADAASAEAVYSSASDAFYPLGAPAPWNNGGYRVEEVEAVPAEVAPGFWYFSGDFFTTPEKEAELAEREAQKAAPLVASIAFVTLAEAGQIDATTATENAQHFAEWAPRVDYSPGMIRRDPEDKALYRVNEGQGHTSQEGWNPSRTPALWTKIGDPAEEWPEWAAPTGAHDAYAKDSKTSHNGKKWVSEIDGNVWEPGVYGWVEVIATD